MLYKEWPGLSSDARIFIVSGVTLSVVCLCRITFSEFEKALELVATKKVGSLCHVTAMQCAMHTGSVSSAAIEKR